MAVLTKDKIKDLVNDPKLAKELHRLAGKYRAENKAGGILDGRVNWLNYEQAMENFLTENHHKAKSGGIKFIRGIKRPFGFYGIAGDLEFRCVLRYNDKGDKMAVEVDY